MTNDFNTALDAFVTAAQAKVDAQYGDSPIRPTLTTMRGRRYVRVVRARGEYDRSAFCFVDTETGDILKAASWKKPANGARGNIFDADPAKAVTGYGAVYFR